MVLDRRGAEPAQPAAAAAASTRAARTRCPAARPRSRRSARPRGGRSPATSTRRPRSRPAPVPGGPADSDRQALADDLDRSLARLGGGRALTASSSVATMTSAKPATSPRAYSRGHQRRRPLAGHLEQRGGQGRAHHRDAGPRLQQARRGRARRWPRRRLPGRFCRAARRVEAHAHVAPVWAGATGVPGPNRRGGARKPRGIAVSRARGPRARGYGAHPRGNRCREFGQAGRGLQ